MGFGVGEIMNFKSRKEVKDTETKTMSSDPRIVGVYGKGIRGIIGFGGVSPEYLTNTGEDLRGCFSPGWWNFY